MMIDEIRDRVRILVCQPDAYKEFTMVARDSSPPSMTFHHQLPTSGPSAFNGAVPITVDVEQGLARVAFGHGQVPPVR